MCYQNRRRPIKPAATERGGDQRARRDVFLQTGDERRQLGLGNGPFTQQPCKARAHFNNRQPRDDTLVARFTKEAINASGATFGMVVLDERTRVKEISEPS